MNFSGSILDANNTNVPTNIILYRAGTNWVMNTFTTSTTNASYSLTLHKRLYDMKIDVFNHSIKFLNVDFTNRSNPLMFDEYNSLEKLIRVDLSDLPGTNYRRIAGILVEVNLTCTAINVTINYTNFNLMNLSYWEGGVTLYKCSEWRYMPPYDGHPTPYCNSTWEILREGPDMINGTTYTHTITATSNTTSLFLAAEREVCGNGYCSSIESCLTCPEDCGACPSAPTGGGGGGGGGGGVYIPPEEEKPDLCGNGICDPGENSENCPSDCAIKGMPAFTVRSTLTDAKLFPGDNESYPVWVTNNLPTNITVSISAHGPISSYLTLEKKTLSIEPRSVETTSVTLSVPETITPGIYKGTLKVQSGETTQELPISLTISEEIGGLLDITVEMLTNKIILNGTAKFHVILYNLGFKKKFDIDLTYLVRDTETEEVLLSEKDNVTLETSYSFFREMPLNQEKIPVGEYYLEVLAQYANKSTSATASFEVIKPFWTPLRLRLVGALLAILIVTSSGYYVRKWYIAQKLAKARYVFPLDYSKLPQDTPESFWLGKIAETDRKACFNPDDLTTHTLVAGSTGSGKSVTASIFVEEALNHKIPVVIFDPTAQWTGFVRPCKDRNLLNKYKEFGMLEEDARPYRGMIFEVTDPHTKIDFKKYMNPGEVTVFTLNKLKPGEYDEAVKTIVSTIFEQGWEESPKLRLLIVFDEVHRLLEKYGGKGGYIALEKACREFRKWGIGLIMASQVSSDFREAVQGNILTEIQMNTKSIEDIKKMEEKYGPEFARRISREAVGVGMIQNPKYNDGKPWFIAFRPTQHSPHKILDEELEAYKKFGKQLEGIETTIEGLKARGIDTFDVELELKLAKNKLKEGRFKMAEIYIDSLAKTIERMKK